jgi:peptidoglycan hydrolase CwlO-like protein
VRVQAEAEVLHVQQHMQQDLDTSQARVTELIGECAQAHASCASVRAQLDELQGQHDMVVAELAEVKASLSEVESRLREVTCEKVRCRALQRYTAVSSIAGVQQCRTGICHDAVAMLLQGGYQL